MAEDLGAVGGEMPGAAVTGLEADDRRLRQGEGLRPGVEGVEGLDVDLVDAVSPLPIIQDEIEMLLLLLLLRYEQATLSYFKVEFGC